MLRASCSPSRIFQKVRICALDHVQLAMPAGGEDKARAFYCGVLGLVEVAKPQHLAARGGCWFESESVKIHLGVDRGFRPATKAHPALRVSGLAELLERCREGGYRVVDDEPLEDCRRAYLADPFGNRIEVLEPKAG